MASQRIGGTAYLKVDGAQYPLKGKFEYSPFATEKTGVAGQDGVHGYNEKPIIQSLKGTLSDLGGISVSALNAITNSTVTCELLNGKVIVLADAWVKGKIDVNSEEGEYEVEFEGMSMQETLPN